MHVDGFRPALHDVRLTGPYSKCDVCRSTSTLATNALPAMPYFFDHTARRLAKDHAACKPEGTVCERIVAVDPFKGSAVQTGEGEPQRAQQCRTSTTVHCSRSRYDFPMHAEAHSRASLLMGPGPLPRRAVAREQIELGRVCLETLPIGRPSGVVGQKVRGP